MSGADIKGIILDLDGTMYWGQKEVPGAARFVMKLKASGVRYLFVTNRTNRTPDEVAAHLRGYGILCEPADVLTAAQATVRRLRPGASVFYIGEEGLRREIDAAGLKVVTESPDYVIVSYDRSLTYEKLKNACRFIQEGAGFIATNPDKFLKTEEGRVPGTGAIVAAVAAGSGVEPMMIGKPEAALMEMALERLGLSAREVIAVGDNLETDIPSADKAGIRSAFMLTGVSTRQDLERASVQPTWIVESFEELGGIVFSP